MAEAKHSIGHSRKPKGRIGVGGQPVLSWDNDIELQPTSSLGSATSAQNTSYNSKESSRHVVAQTWTGGSKQAFSTSRKKDKDSSFATANFLSKNAPVKVSVSGEWALQECDEFSNWANLLMRRGRYRAISDIRKSIGDGQTLVHMLEILSGEKIPGVYARPITRAQKLENLQLCMSFMGNRSINLQGIYVGDLIDGNVNSVLSLCGNLRKRFEGSRAATPELARPASSGSVKDIELSKSNKMMNGHVINGMKEFDGDFKPHGNSSGYHSEEHSPTRISIPHMGLEMPGMMVDPDTLSSTTRTLRPTDIIVSTTKLDRKAVYQSGVEHRKHIPIPQFPQEQEESDLISPSVEDRLRSLLCTPNPGGQNIEEDTEDEFMIPPRRTSDSKPEDRFDVEERLKSLLDDAADGFSENDDDYDDDEQRRLETLRELDAIGYMPSHPSEKMRNVPTKNERKDSFTGRNKPRNTKLPTPPALRRLHNARANQAFHERGTERQRKMSVTNGPGLSMTRTTVSSAELPKLKQPNFQAENDRRARRFYSEKDNLGERSPPLRGRSSSHSDFLQQVASRLENEVGNLDTTTASSTSISPADTPMLPELSPSSSIASIMIDSSSDSSGMITPVRNYYNKLKGGHKSPRSSGSSTPMKRGRGRTGSNNISGHGKAKSTNDLESIRTQILSLESMYTDVLTLLDDGVNDSNKKLRVKEKNAANLQKTDEMKGGIVTFSKQRSKDIKAVNKRFGRLESHVVTLARSVAHLSSELRSQAAFSEDLEEMRKDIQKLRTWQNENECKKAGGVEQSLQHAVNLKRVNKLRKFFGEEPPLLVIFLKKLGYERFAANFVAEQIGILELPYLNEERLQSLGIPLGPRLRIMEEANKLLL